MKEELMILDELIHDKYDRLIQNERKFMIYGGELGKKLNFLDKLGNLDLISRQIICPLSHKSVKRKI